MKNRQYGFLLLIAVAGIILTCNSPVDTPEYRQPIKEGYGRVVFNFTGVGAPRTAFPAFTDVDFEYYFNDVKKKPASGTSFLLEAGTYDVEVRALIDNVLVGIGTYKNLVVESTGISSATVSIMPVVAAAQGADPGIFTYTITVPSGSRVICTLNKLDGTKVHDTDETATGTTVTGTLNPLDAGAYRFTVKVTSGAQYAGLREAVYIYPNQTTTYKPEFKANEMLTKTVTSIAVKTQPELTYTHRDTLDLSKLVVTLTYNDGSTSDVAYGDFDSNISASPANGDVLSRTANGGSPVTITYSGVTPSAVTDNLTVNAKDINDSSVTIDPIADQTYTGLSLTPTINIIDGSYTLEDTDYTAAYSNNTNVGTATVTITGKGDYKNTKDTTFTITPKVVTFDIDPIADQAWTGSAIEPTVIVKDGAKELTLTTDYTVAYSDNTNVGPATVTVTGAGNYAGSSGSAEFKIYAVVTFDKNHSDASGFTDANPQTKTVTPPAATVETLPTAPTRTGYNFKGWYDDANAAGGTAFTATTAVTGNITVYARWEQVFSFGIDIQWEDYIDDQFTLPTGLSVAKDQPLLIDPVIPSGYAVSAWILDAAKPPFPKGNTYTFQSSSVGEHSLTLIVEKDVNGTMKYASVIIKVTVTQ
ncbi:MAG: InlB B-repeat-containing protein [Treponema sp.]|jgi:uncharacterized repeat protein (TIGR02543 family)|nr:InlB B-repeat-containing protein [Treponema sp.]